MGLWGFIGRLLGISRREPSTIPIDVVPEPCLLCGTSNGVVNGVCRYCDNMGLPESVSPGTKMEIQQYLKEQIPIGYKEAMDLAPREPGIYVFFFDRIPEVVRTEECFRQGNWTLLYVGKAKNIRDRIKQHFNGTDATASGAIRESIGCLLKDKLSIHLYRKANVKDVWTFASDGEKRLSRWLQTHARVVWVSLRDDSILWPCASNFSDNIKVEIVEDDLINIHFIAPLNRQQTRGHIANAVRKIWEKCKADADVLS